MDAAGRLIEMKNKKGMTLVYVALLLVVLIAFVGLGVDIGYMYVAKGQLQNAADAAALAGASNLDGTNSIIQGNARDAAFRLASSNRVVPSGTAVHIDHPLPNDTVSDTTNNALTPGNDIVAGHWNGKFTFNNTSSINAVQVRARRTADSPGGQVDVFFGKILSVIGLTSWGKMSTQAQSVAVRSPLITPGISICIETCTLGLPHPLILQKDPKQAPINDGMAWTAFNCQQAPNIGTNGDVVGFINGKAPPLPLCNICITTNNGVGQALQTLSDNYNNPNFDSANKKTEGGIVRWTVAAVVIDYTCISCVNSAQKNPNGCPPGGQGNTEPYHISNIATIVISGVDTSGSNKGINIDTIFCPPTCPLSLPLGNGVKLVQ